VLALWLHRVAFAPVLLAILVVAFSLTERPRPIRTTLAPDAFMGARAAAALRELERAGDTAPARVAARLRAAGLPARLTTGPEGQRVVAERAGRDPRRLLVVAPLPEAPRGPGELSGAAALAELARVVEGRAMRRTLTFVLTRDAGRGRSALRALAREFRAGGGRQVGAVLVLGDVVGTPQRAGVVVPWADAGGAAPLRLRRTVEDAVRLEAGAEPRAPRALAQFLRFAAPLTIAPQGPFGGAGLPAVTLSASGERGPDPAAAPEPSPELVAARLQGYGRSALRAISALDNGPSVPAGPREQVVVAGQVLPEWAVRLLAGALLLPLLLAAVDGLARVRRRRFAVVPWLRWLLATSVPFLLAAGFARLLGAVGLLPAPGGPAPPAAVPVEVAGLVAVALAFVLGWLVRPALVRLAVPRALRQDPASAEAGRPGAACAVALALAAVGLGVWVVNPFTLVVLAPTLHLWLLAAAPEVRSRAGGLVLVLAGLVPLAVLALFHATQLGLSARELAWLLVLQLTGGGAGPLGVAGFALLGGCGAAALLLALARRPAGAAPAAPDRERRSRPPARFTVLEPVSGR